MVAMLVSNTLYCFNVIIEEKDLPEYLVGGSLMTTILLYACSYALKLGSWHRLIVTAYIINITIATIDVLHRSKSSCIRTRDTGLVDNPKPGIGRVSKSVKSGLSRIIMPISYSTG